MTVVAKAIINVFYGSRPKFSYWNSCSSGGRQGLMEAQRFPADYDGIVAGAPANPPDSARVLERIRRTGGSRNPANTIPAAKYPMIIKQDQRV